MFNCQKKFEGTRVTVESFLAWQKTFLERRTLQRKKQKEELAAKGKLTGRQLFMRDTSLNDSDLQFRQAEGETVAVDESLFEDLEDLDLGDEDDDEDDPDWVPNESD